MDYLDLDQDMFTLLKEEIIQVILVRLLSNQVPLEVIIYLDHKKKPIMENIYISELISDKYIVFI